VRVAVEVDRGGATREEVLHPLTEGSRKTEATEEGNHAVASDVVEEAFDIKEQDGGRLPGGDSGPSNVSQAQSCISGAVIISGAKLSGREDVKRVGGIQESS
jgi:hypothetical protein